MPSQLCSSGSSAQGQPCNQPPARTLFPEGLLYFPCSAHAHWHYFPVLLWSWETDPDCKRVTSSHSPAVRHWGDALQSDPRQVASLLHCPADTLVLVCSSPPCTDFSQIRNTQPGLQGQEGCKFRQWCQWFSNFRQAWQRRHILLLENVVPSADLHRELDELVGHNSFVVDAASWGVVSRPRLWWSNVLTPPPQVLLAACNVIPVTSGPVETWYPPVEPLPWASSNLNPLGSRPIERAAAIWLRSGTSWDPREAEPYQLAGPSDDPIIRTP